MAKGFLFDINPRAGDQEMTKGDTTYRMKTGVSGVTFHILNEDVSDSIDLTIAQLKALYQLCTIDNGKI